MSVEKQPQNAKGEPPCKANLTFLEAEDRAPGGNIQEEATSKVEIQLGLTQPTDEGWRDHQGHTRQPKTPKLLSHAPKAAKVSLA